MLGLNLCTSIPFVLFLWRHLFVLTVFTPISLLRILFLVRYCIFFSDNSCPFHTDLCFLPTCLTVFELEDILLRAVLLVMLFCSLFVPFYVLFCLLFDFDDFFSTY